MGAQGFLVATALRAVLAQRLIRKLCVECRSPKEPSERERAAARQLLGETASMLHFNGAQGCSTCNQTGYKGRIGIYELLHMSGEIREMVMHRTNSMQIAKKAAETGVLLPLRQSGFEKVADGHTTFAEVLRATKR